MDIAESKALVVEKALSLHCFVVAASGIAGYGQTLLTKRKLNNLVVIGDFKSDMQQFSVLAPKVTWAAAMMCDAVIEHILDK